MRAFTKHHELMPASEIIFKIALKLNMEIFPIGSKDIIIKWIARLLPNIIYRIDS